LGKNNGRILKIIDGSANTPLVDDICFNSNLIGSEVKDVVSTFSDKETQIEIEENMRGCDVFVIQPTSSPANEHLMQLYFILDALKRSNCWRVTAVIPYYGYGRQDKKLKPRVPISAKSVASLIEFGGVNRVLTMDLHANQIQGFFNCPVDNLFASSIFLPYMRKHVDPNSVIVSPDEGGIARAVHYSKALGLPAAMIHKSRLIANEVDKMILLGSVRNMHAIIIDDMCDTATTLCKGAAILKDAGALSVEAFVTHGVFSGKAYEKIADSAFEVVNVTDSIKQSTIYTEKINVISCADLFAKAILNIHDETSVSCLFE